MDQTRIKVGAAVAPQTEKAINDHAQALGVSKGTILDAMFLMDAEKLRPLLKTYVEKAQAAYPHAAAGRKKGAVVKKAPQAPVQPVAASEPVSLSLAETAGQSTGDAGLDAMLSELEGEALSPIEQAKRQVLAIQTRNAQEAQARFKRRLQLQAEINAKVESGELVVGESDDLSQTERDRPIGGAIEWAGSPALACGHEPN